MPTETPFGGGRSEHDALTQKDIDQLLGAGGTTARARAATIEVHPYNFLRPPRISKDRRVTLESIFSRFAVSLQSLLSSRLRAPMDVSCSVEQATFSEYVLSIANPCAAFVFELGGAAGATAGAIDLSTDFAFHVVDRVFGGPGEATRLDRPLTMLERSVTKGVVEKVLALFKEAWQDHVAFDPRVIGFESTPEMIPVASHEDNVLVANLEIRSGDFTGLTALCIPLHAIESFLGEKSSRSPVTTRSQGAASEQRRSVAAAVQLARVDVAARFPTLRVTAREIARLKVGQIIQTTHTVDAPVDLLINGQRRFVGSLGQFRRMLGLRITRVVAPDGAALAGRPTRGRIQ
jgi:flagellar motor switch protein FliM